jgi:hypothetical protein
MFKQLMTKITDHHLFGFRRNRQLSNLLHSKNKEDAMISTPSIDTFQQSLGLVKLLLKHV